MDHKSNGRVRRADINQQLDWALRDMSTSAVVSASAIAQQVGMGPNDMKCAELLVRKGAMTAGQLAEESGLTTGAITGVVDRLEKAGWARRDADPTDRRRIFINPVPKDSQTIAGLYDTYSEATSELLGKYSVKELSLILTFIQNLTKINYQIVAREKPAI
jgi:DNA-binding MarR family transcriptional regulator